MKKLPHLFLLFAAVFAVCCQNPEPEPEPGNGPDSGVSGDEGTTSWRITGISIPENIVVKTGDKVNFNAKGVLSGDIITLDGENDFEVEVSILGETLCAFNIPAELKTGIYDIFLSRGGTSQKLASSYIAIITGDEVPDLAGMNVKGVVHCGGSPVEGVAVTNGYDVTLTNAYGMYWLDSEKKSDDYIYISIPSGYKCASNNGVIPLFFKHTTGSVSAVERIDFELVQEANQTKHRILVMGDMHLAGRTNNDVGQFQNFIQDMNETVAATSVPVYGLTLGDMTWDTFWYRYDFAFPEYLEQVNKINNLTIFHTIGNHDHELGYSGNYPVGEYATVSKYKNAIGPNYYSFNIGDIHYVVLDDIESTNDGGGSASYNIRITSEQLSWLKQDLSYVDKSKTLVVTAHSQIHSKTGGKVLTNYDDLMSAIDPFAEVHIFTGHTHLVYNHVVSGYYDNIMEHNSGAVCGTWWWSGYHSSGLHICQDGAPGGYTIVDVNGGELEWQYKGTGKDVDYQFRTYDGNNILITADIYCADKSTANKTAFNNYASSWTVKSSDNYVYINVWNWDPQWKIEVTEEGRPLEATKVSLTDPLHLIAYTAPSISTPTFATSVNHHFFRVKASSATSTLNIKVTDRFGNVYTETMTRPKEFSISNYNTNN